MLKTLITIDQIVQDFGDYYVAEGQGLANLHMLPFESFDTRDAFTIVPTDNTELRESNVEVGEILQQYQEDFTAKGSMTFEPVRIPLYQVKIDQFITPGQVQRSWLGFLSQNHATVEDWPLVRFIFEEYLMKQSNQDMEMHAIYKGVYEAPEEGVPGEPYKVMDGIEKTLNDFITAGKLTPIITGALSTTPADFVTQMETFIQSLPEKYRYMKMELNMNRTLRDRFKQGMRKKYNENYSQVTDRLVMADFDNISIVGRPSMLGKNKIWCTPKYNALMGVKGMEKMTAFEIERQDRKLKVWTDWWAGIGFIQPKLIFTNEQV